MKTADSGNKTATRLVIVTGLGLALLGLAVLTGQWTNNALLAAVSAWTGKTIAAHWLGRLHGLGVDLLLVGAGTAVVGALLVGRSAPKTPAAQIDQDGWRQWLGWIVLLWLMLTANAFSLGFMGNEVDVLPSARQTVDPAWLPNDWYLNLDIGYRRPGNLMAGWLVSWLGFLPGAYVGRVVLYLFLAVALAAFFRALGLRLWLALLVLTPFLIDQSLVAGEWIVGGVDTKTVAYSCAFLALAAFVRRRYTFGLAFAGAAVSFHVLVGLYALFCAVVAMTLLPAWRADWRTLLRWSWVFVLTGAFGLLAVFEQLSPQTGVDTATAWQIYVQLRVPHHVLPSAWHGYLWIVKLGLATLLFLVVLLGSRSQKMRFVAAYALAGVVLFLVGLGIYAVGATALLRFYWFRFPDVMTPFLATVLVAMLVDDFIDGRVAVRHEQLRAIVAHSGPVLVAAAAVLFTLNSMRASAARPLTSTATATRSTWEWIADNTDEQAVFLVDPSLADFYVTAQRAMFVSRKHSPQSAAEILEWRQRIKLASGDDTSGLMAEDVEEDGFYLLSEVEIRQLATSYGISYYLGRPDQQLPFEPVFSNSEFTLYTGLAPIDAGQP